MTPENDHHDELSILRRKHDEHYASQLASCQAGIGAIETAMSALRESMHTQLGAIQIQIAKLPAPISLEELERRFVLRIEREKEQSLIDKLLDTYITKEEIRPLKMALYSIWFTIAGSVLVAILIALIRGVRP